MTASGSPELDSNGQPVMKDYSPVLDQATGQMMYKVSLAPDTLLHPTPSSAPGVKASAMHAPTNSRSSSTAVSPPKPGL